jgi:hypothetical protein
MMRAVDRKKVRRITVAAISSLFPLSTLTPLTVGAATPSKSTPVPLMLIGATGTPYTFILSSYSVGCHKASCLELQRTSDGGRHFTSLHLPPLTDRSDSSTGNLRQLVFANQRDGYILLYPPKVNQLFPNYMFVTTDGARTWRRASIGRNESILAVDVTQQFLYSEVAHCTAAYTCTNYLLARSSSTALKWTETPLPLDLLRHSYADYFGVAAFGSNVWLTYQGPKRPLLYTSRDAGKTFRVSSAPALGSVTACSLTPESANVIWAECPTGNFVSFFVTVDSGGHWTNFSGPGFAGTGGGSFEPVSGSLAYLDYGLTTALRPKNLYRITNGGRTSTPVGVLRCSDVQGLVFTDARNGLAICDTNFSSSSTYLARTSDAGATWSHVAPFYVPI